MVYIGEFCHIETLTLLNLIFVCSYSSDCDNACLSEILIDLYDRYLQELRIMSTRLRRTTFALLKWTDIRFDFVKWWVTRQNMFKDLPLFLSGTTTHFEFNSVWKHLGGVECLPYLSAKLINVPRFKGSEFRGRNNLISRLHPQKLWTCFKITVSNFVHSNHRQPIMVSTTYRLCTRCDRCPCAAIETLRMSQTGQIKSPNQ